MSNLLRAWIRSPKKLNEPVELALDSEQLRTVISSLESRCRELRAGNYHLPSASRGHELYCEASACLERIDAALRRSESARR
jgi:hypothetical protein